MTKAELIEIIAEDAGLSKAEAKRALNAFIKTTTRALKKGDRVKIVGFGSFTISKRSTRTGRMPDTSKFTTISAKREVKFKAGADLERAVRGNGTEDTGPRKRRKK